MKQHAEETHWYYNPN